MGGLKILALLEATSITGTAKAVLEVAYESRDDASGQRNLKVLPALFARGSAEIENSLTRAFEAAAMPYSVIREQGRYDASVLPQIQNLVAQHQPEVIWTNSVKSHFLARKAKVQKNCKWVAFHHGYTATDLKMKLYNQLDRVSLRNADRVLTVCKPFAEQMLERGVGPGRIRVQHMPVRPFVISKEDAAQLRQELCLPLQTKVILSVGRLSKEKGHVDLIKAFVELKDRNVKLVMVGDGPERKSLGAADGVIFTGHRDDVKRFYGIASVFALPSYSEGTPNVLLEAMAAGVPVVATKVGGIPELAAHEKNALLVPPGKPMDLAQALRRLLDSEALRWELAGRAAEIVAAHSPRSYYAEMRDHFLEVAAE